MSSSIVAQPSELELFTGHPVKIAIFEGSMDLLLQLVKQEELDIYEVEIAQITPPVCLTLYVAQGIIKEVPLGDILKAGLWFILCDVLALVLLIAFPQISTFLPNMMTGG